MPVIAAARKAGAATPPPDPKKLNWVFFLIFFANLLINFDSGAVPSALLAIREELDLGYGAQGALGGLVYLGLTVASLGAGHLLQNYPQRRVVAVFTALNACMMVVFGMSTETWMLLVARFSTGLTQAFLVIFSPVWVDEFAPKSQQTLYMSLLQLAPALGIMIGYVCGIVAGSGEIFPRWSAWRLPFICQGLVMLPAAIGIGCLPAYLIETSNRSGPRSGLTPKKYDGLANPDVGRLSPFHEADEMASPAADDDVSPDNSISISMERDVDLHIAGRHPSESIELSPDDKNVTLSNGRVHKSNKVEKDTDSEGDYSPQMDNSRSGQQPSALHLSPPSRSIGGRSSSITNRRTSLFTDGTSDGQKATVTRKHSLLISTSVLGRPMVSEFDMTPVMGLVNKRFSKSSQLGVGSPAPSLPPLEEAHPVPLMMLGDRSDGPNSWTMLKKLMCNGVFITTVNALAALYFVVTGIQFWVTPYCVTVLGAGIGATGGSFVAISATAPTIGVVFGGWITDKRGGYQGYEQAVKTLKLNLVFCFLAMVSCIMTTVFTTLGGVMPCITIMLFFGAAVVPSSTGIVIDAVEPEERAFSSAMSQMVCNILGYALSPFLSGFVAEYAGGPEGLGLKWGFRLVCWWGCFSFVFMVMAVWQASKRLNRDTKAKNIESKKRLKEEKAKKEDAEMEDEGDFEAEFEGGGKGWSSSLRGGLMRDASA